METPTSVQIDRVDLDQIEQIENLVTRLQGRLAAHRNGRNQVAVAEGNLEAMKMQAGEAPTDEDLGQIEKAEGAIVEAKKGVTFLLVQMKGDIFRTGNTMRNLHQERADLVKLQRQQGPPVPDTEE